MELLPHEAAVHVADVDDVDVPGLDAGMGDGFGRRAGEELILEHRIERSTVVHLALQDHRVDLGQV